jgi:type I restriction enzyme R subunit
MRPIFSPTDFIQIKGRGTRVYDFVQDILDPQRKQELGAKKKQGFKLFDFFANCEYFEEKFDYDEVIQLPPILKPAIPPVHEEPKPPIGEYETFDPDKIASFRVNEVGAEGMKIDRMYFDKFQQRIKADPLVLEKIQSGDWDTALKQVEERYFDKPEEFYNLEKLRKAVNADRRLTLREILELIFGLIPYIKTRDELLEEAFEQFDSRYMPPDDVFNNAKNFFKTYVVDLDFRKQVDEGNFPSLIATHPSGEFLRQLSIELRRKIIDYVKDYVPLNQFAI